MSEVSHLIRGLPILSEPPTFHIRSPSSCQRCPSIDQRLPLHVRGSSILSTYQRAPNLIRAPHQIRVHTFMSIFLCIEVDNHITAPHFTPEVPPSCQSFFHHIRVLSSISDLNRMPCSRLPGGNPNRVCEGTNKINRNFLNRLLS